METVQHGHASLNAIQHSMDKIQQDYAYQDVHSMVHLLKFKKIYV